ncbi:MAG: class I SAM-dependent methyltransferase [Actinomycetota bacterium]
MSVHEEVADHYRQPALVDRIEAGFRAAGIDIDSITTEQLAMVDEFHTGGRPATEYLMDALGFEAGARVLDLGCGVGGPARYGAEQRGLAVTGVDLTDAYVEVAERLSSWVGLDDRTSFRTVEAGPLPFEDDEFDGAYLIHVGMNVPDKAALFAEIRRVLRPGGRFGVYDLLATEEPGPEFPAPWSTEAATSFLETRAAYESALAQAGFEQVEVDDRTEPIKAFMADIAARAAEAPGPPPVGLHLLMGPDAGQKLGNMLAALQRGGLAPTVLTATVPG